LIGGWFALSGCARDKRDRTRAAIDAAGLAVEQLATRDGWEAFLSQYPDGFYANLAKGQLKKIAEDDPDMSR
jgi:hypothetical protein